MRLPSGENATHMTPPVGTWTDRSSCPVCKSHTFTCPHSASDQRNAMLPETMRVPSGENAALLTDQIVPLVLWSSLAPGWRTAATVAVTIIIPRRPNTNVWRLGAGGG